MGETSAPEQQKFYNDDVHQGLIILVAKEFQKQICLSLSILLIYLCAFDLICMEKRCYNNNNCYYYYYYRKFFCSSENELQQNSYVSFKEEYIPRIMTAFW